jgi:hypothetical protein
MIAALLNPTVDGLGAQTAPMVGEAESGMHGAGLWPWQ